MSDRQAAEGPAFWSPAARRGSAGGVGERQGVEGSQTAASGTQRPGLWKGGCRSARGRARRATRIPTAPGTTAALQVFFYSVSKRLGSRPASFFGPAWLAVRLLPPHLRGVCLRLCPTSVCTALTSRPCLWLRARPHLCPPDSLRALLPASSWAPAFLCRSPTLLRLGPRVQPRSPASFRLGEMERSQNWEVLKEHLSRSKGRN